MAEHNPFLDVDDPFAADERPRGAATTAAPAPATSAAGKKGAGAKAGAKGKGKGVTPAAAAPAAVATPMTTAAPPASTPAKKPIFDITAPAASTSPREVNVFDSPKAPLAAVPSAASTSSPLAFSGAVAPRPVASAVVAAAPSAEAEAAAAADDRAALEGAELTASDLARRPKNWPRCYPIARVAVNEDIPKNHRVAVWFAYIAFLLFLSAALMNFVCIIFFVASNETSDNTNEGNPMGLLLGPLYVLVGGAMGFWHFKQLYHAIAVDSSRAFCCFFVFGGIHTLFVTICAVGIVGTYMCGILVMIDIVANWKSTVDKITVVIACVLWASAAAVNVWAFMVAHRSYRLRGAEGAAAVKKDLASAAAKGITESLIGTDA